MIELNLAEKLLTLAVQMILYLAYPWQTNSRGDVILLLITLGVVSVAVVGGAEWFIEHCLNIKLPD